jgi:ABC-type bacteriocin/lantibiotic exporter with double-glycine peptidase domain
VVRDLLSGQLLKGVLDIGILLIIGIYMAFNSLVLTMFVFVFAGINMLVIYFSRPKIAEANQKEIMKHSASKQQVLKMSCTINGRLNSMN